MNEENDNYQMIDSSQRPRKSAGCVHLITKNDILHGDVEYISLQVCIIKHWFVKNIIIKYSFVWV